MNKISIASVFCMLVCWASNVHADIDVHEFSSAENQETYQNLTRELRCPKCQNQDIADSNAPIAQDMRAQVFRLVEEGKTHDQVVDFMVERFGEFVTYKPKVSTETYLLWYGPGLFVLIGLGIVILLAQKSKRSRGKAEAKSDLRNDDASKNDLTVEELLKRYSDD